MNEKLSIILCSRNDFYKGSSLKRLTNTLNCITFFIEKLNLINRVEVIVCDYFSETPIIESINLYKKKDFIKILTPSKKFCKESVFSIPHALNFCIDHCSFNFILKIDQDTIPGISFFDWFFSSSKLPNLAYSQSRSLDELQSKDPIKHVLSDDINEFVINQPHYAYNCFYRNNICPFFGSARGIFIFNKSLINQRSFLNEDLIFKKYIDINFINSLCAHSPVYNLGLKLNFDFYHQYHSSNLDEKLNSPLYKSNFFNY